MWLSLAEHLVWDQGVAGSNPVIPTSQRDVAQLGRAPGLGPGGRRFESCRPDQRYLDGFMVCAQVLRRGPALFICLEKEGSGRSSFF
jgi:hypothetical protein